MSEKILIKKILKNQLPKKHKVVPAQVKFDENFIYTEIEIEEDFNPMDGDYLVDKDGYIFIYCDERKSEGMACAYCYLIKSTNQVYNYKLINIAKISDCRYAEKEEIDRLNDGLQKIYNEMWNPFYKTTTKYINRKKMYDYYFVINFEKYNVERKPDYYYPENDADYYHGNYFLNEEEVRMKYEEIMDFLK